VILRKIKYRIDAWVHRLLWFTRISDFGTRAHLYRPLGLGAASVWLRLRARGWVSERLRLAADARGRS
jgi:hypothetical protein